MNKSNIHKLKISDFYDFKISVHGEVYDNFSMINLISP